MSINVKWHFLAGTSPENKPVPTCQPWSDHCMSLNWEGSLASDAICSQCKGGEPVRLGVTKSQGTSSTPGGPALNTASDQLIQVVFLEEAVQANKIIKVCLGMYSRQIDHIVSNSNCWQPCISIFKDKTFSIGNRKGKLPVLLPDYIHGTSRVSQDSSTLFFFIYIFLILYIYHQHHNKCKNAYLDYEVARRVGNNRCCAGQVHLRFKSFWSFVRDEL